MNFLQPIREQFSSISLKSKLRQIFLIELQKNFHLEYHSRNITKSCTLSKTLYYSWIEFGCKHIIVPLSLQLYFQSEVRNFFTGSILAHLEQCRNEKQIIQWLTWQGLTQKWYRRLGFNGPNGRPFVKRQENLNWVYRSENPLSQEQNLQHPFLSPQPIVIFNIVH